MATDLRTRAAAALELRRRDRARWREDPVAFARERLALTLTPDQEAVLTSVRDNLRTFVKAGNGTGKTFVSSVVVAWTMECFDGAIVVTSGPKFDQVRDLLWKEIRMRYAEARPPLRGALLPKDPRWDISAGSFAVGRTADSEEGFKGVHASGRLLVVLDEGPGVPEYIYKAAIGMLQGPDARLLTIGNPTVSSGSFYAAFHTKSEINATITMSPATHPNILEALGELGVTWDDFVSAPFGEFRLPPDWRDPFPGAISLTTLELYKVEIGVGSPDWDSMVGGQFPSASERAIVDGAWLDLARGGGYTDPKTPLPARLAVPTGKWAGLDVARFGNDRSVLVRFDGRRCVSIESWRGHELGHTTSMGADAIREGYVLNFDEGGLGAAVTSGLKDHGFREGVDFRPNNAGAKPDDDSFPRMRDQLWYDAADLLRAGVIDLSALPYESYQALRGELLAVQAKDRDGAGRRRVESKEEMKKRIGRSPDLADAFNLALWRPRRGAGGIVFDAGAGDSLLSARF